MKTPYNKPFRSGRGAGGVFRSSASGLARCGAVSVCGLLLLISSTGMAQDTTATGGVRIRSLAGRDIHIIRRVLPIAGPEAPPAVRTPGAPFPGLSRQDLDSLEERIVRRLERRLADIARGGPGRAGGGGSTSILVPGQATGSISSTRVETVYVRAPVTDTTPAALPRADTAAVPTPERPSRVDTVVLPAPPPQILVQEIERSILEKGLFTALDVIFEFNKSRLMPRSYATLDALGEVLVRHPELAVTIEGHTDNIGSAEYNMKLSRARAEAARDYLVGKYPDLGRGRLTAEGFGFTHPVADNANETGRALNRRVEFRVTEK